MYLWARTRSKWWTGQRSEEIIWRFANSLKSSKPSFLHLSLLPTASISSSFVLRWPLTFKCPLELLNVNWIFVLKLHQGLTPQDDRSPFDSAFSTVSFACLVTRVLGVSLTGAKVNEYVHLILIPIQRCSSDDYCVELERLERMLACGPIGLGGLGCFVITRAFLLVVLSVVFTVEIVLLQASATPTSPHTWNLQRVSIVGTNMW